MTLGNYYGNMTKTQLEDELKGLKKELEDLEMQKDNLGDKIDLTEREIEDVEDLIEIAEEK